MIEGALTEEQIDSAARAICKARGLDPDAPYKITWWTGMETAFQIYPNMTNADHFRDLARDILAVEVRRAFKAEAAEEDTRRGRPLQIECASCGLMMSRRTDNSYRCFCGNAVGMPK